jgi:putative tryptophan/tyrosine transport system substrate-binding protein
VDGLGIPASENLHNKRLMHCKKDWIKARHAAPTAIGYRSSRRRSPMRRREFITGLGGAAAWSCATRAQQAERVRHIGVLTNFTESDQILQAYMTAFREGLTKLGWIEERSFRIELRFGGADADRFRAYAAELVKLAPDVIVTDSVAGTRAIQQQTRTIPVVITGAGDVVANGIVKNLARPEGNTTGVTAFFYSFGGKWLELLKEAVPRIETVALIYNAQLVPNDRGYGYYFPSIEEAAHVLAVKTIQMPYRNAVDIVRAIDAFSAEPNGGLIVLPPPPTAADRVTILHLATQHRLPAIYFSRPFAAEGGLMAYGSNTAERYRRASSFVDRILRGTKVNELPVEFPTNFELVINLKTAKEMGLEIPPALLLRADEVIE